MKSVTVLLGGCGKEREVSLNSGNATLSALNELGFLTSTIDLPSDLNELITQLTETKPDVVFNCLHGPIGEDGTVQGILNKLNIPYTHSGVLASTNAMDKWTSYQIFKNNNIPTPETVKINLANTAKCPITYPCMAKPINEGSSVGIFIIRKGDNRPPAALGAEDWNLSSEMMVEEFVPGRELTVSVMGDRPLCVTEITTTLEFYDYEAKYAPGGSKHVLPAQVSDSVARDCMEMSVIAHKALGCRGVSRTDFRYDDTTDKPRLILLETNTQPGMTPTSLVPEQAAYVGMSYAKLCRWMVEDASCDR